MAYVLLERSELNGLSNKMYLAKSHQVIILKIVFINTISNSPLIINVKFSYGKFSYFIGCGY